MTTVKTIVFALKTQLASVAIILFDDSRRLLLLGIKVNCGGNRLLPPGEETIT
jgi:hypothetical protein